MKMNKTLIKVAAGLAVIAGAVAVAQPASANSASTSGTQDGANSIRYWNTARTDTHDANYDQFKLNTASTLAGGYFTIAFRNSAGTSYARATNITSLNKWYVVKNDSGRVYNPPRTFYTNTQITGSCGSGCGTISWTGSISWNVQYT